MAGAQHPDRRLFGEGHGAARWRPERKTRPRPVRKRAILKPRRRNHRQRARGQRRRGLRRQRLKITRDQPGIHIARRKAPVPRQRRKEGKVGHRARHLRFIERTRQLRQRRRTGRPMHDHLGDHRVIPRADRVARAHPGIGAATGRKHQMLQPPGRGQEAGGHVFGVKPRFKGMAADAQIVLPGGQRLARGHAQLPFDQIEAGDRLGHRMLNLKPRVHFHEPETVRAQPVRAVDDKLDRARALVADGLGRAHRRHPHRLAHLGRHAGRGSLFDHLLVAALQRTVTLKEMHRMGAIAKHLHLDMARLFHVFLDQHGGVAKGGLRLALRRGQRRRKIARAFDQPHTLAAAARHRLDQHRIADFPGRTRQIGRVLVFAVIARHDRHARLVHQGLRRILQPHRPDRIRRGPDKHQPRRLDRIDEAGVFRQKPVARMDRLGAGFQRRRDDRIAAQIAVARRRAADGHRLIGQRHMARAGIGLGINGDGRHAQTARAVDDAAGDFATVGDQDLAKHLGSPCECGGGPAPRQGDALAPPGVFFQEETPLLLGQNTPAGGENYIRNTPKRVGSMGAQRLADSDNPSTSRVRRGSMMPSSHSRAEA